MTGCYDAAQCEASQVDLFPITTPPKVFYFSNTRVIWPGLQQHIIPFYQLIAAFDITYTYIYSSHSLTRDIFLNVIHYMFKGTFAYSKFNQLTDSVLSTIICGMASLSDMFMWNVLNHKIKQMAYKGTNAQTAATV